MAGVPRWYPGAALAETWRSTGQEVQERVRKKKWVGGPREFRGVPEIPRKDQTVSDILPIAEAIARRAGAIVMEGFGHVRQVRQKGVIDLVTEFDQRSEEVIVSALQKEFPEHAILAEETRSSPQDQ